jgi:hypothetical protein
MEKYVYLASQLPLLTFDKEPAMPVTAFLEEGRKWLSPADWKTLNEVSINAVTTEKSDLTALRDYKNYEHALRSELLQYRRTLRSREDYKPALFPPTILKEGNPLEVEKKLLRLRWQRIEELEFGHYADLEFLTLYYLRLQILMRLQKFDREVGKAKFKTIIEASL